MKYEGKGKGFKEWFGNLSKGKKIALIAAIVILILAAIAGAVMGYAASKLSKLDTDDSFASDDVLINENAQDIGIGYTNFVLFGADSRKNDVTSDLNTDSIIIVSLNNETKELKMVSVYRDTLMDLTTGNIQKCNSAYRRGGAKQALSMLNMNLDLNLQKYVTVNWSVVSDVVDMLGGVEVDVTEAEMKEMNKFIKETARVAGKPGNLITEAGLLKLDGVQATTYARIRKNVGNDYARTERQRELIGLVLKKAIKADLVTINKIIDTVFPQISTNFTMTEIIKYASNITKFEIVDNTGFPFNKDNATLKGRGSCAFSRDFVGDVSELHGFLFGTVEYEPSSKVESIAYEVMQIVNATKGTSSGDDEEEDVDVDDETTSDTSTSQTTADNGNDTTEDSTGTGENNTSGEDGATDSENTISQETSTEETSTKEETTTQQEVTTTESTNNSPDGNTPESGEDANPAAQEGASPASF